jgi:hypothetical protein
MGIRSEVEIGKCTQNDCYYQKWNTCRKRNVKFSYSPLYGLECQSYKHYQSTPIKKGESNE